MIAAVFPFGNPFGVNDAIMGLSVVLVLWDRGTDPHNHRPSWGWLKVAWLGLGLSVLSVLTGQKASLSLSESRSGRVRSSIRRCVGSRLVFFIPFSKLLELLDIGVQIGTSACKPTHTAPQALIWAICSALVGR